MLWKITIFIELEVTKVSLLAILCPFISLPLTTKEKLIFTMLVNVI